MHDNNNKGFGYRLGQLVGSVVIICGITIVMALTLKFLFWLF